MMRIMPIFQIESLRNYNHSNTVAKNTGYLQHDLIIELTSQCLAHISSPVVTVDVIPPAL